MRKERDSNPRYVTVNTLSKRAPSTTRPPFHSIYYTQILSNKQDFYETIILKFLEDCFTT